MAKERLPFGGQGGDGGGLFRAPVPPAGQSMGLGRNALGQFTPERFALDQDAWLKATEQVGALGGASEQAGKSLFHISTRMYGIAGITLAFSTAMKAINDWSKASSDSAKQIQESSRAWATAMGVATMTERLAALRGDVTRQQTAYEADYGPGGIRGAPYQWGGTATRASFAVQQKEGQINWRELLGLPNPEKEFLRRTYELDAARDRVRVMERYAKGSGGGVMVNSFADVGREIQKEILQEQQTELLREVRDAIFGVDDTLQKNLGTIP